MRRDHAGDRGAHPQPEVRVVAAPHRGDLGPGNLQVVARLEEASLRNRPRGVESLVAGDVALDSAAHGVSSIPTRIGAIQPSVLVHRNGDLQAIGRQTHTVQRQPA